MPRLLIGFLLLQLLPICVYAHAGAVDANGCHRTGSGPRHCHGERAIAQSTHAQSSAVPKAGEEGVLDGVLQWVTDGDSLRVLVKGKDMEIRLADVDAPERDQVYGWNAKLTLIDLVRGKHIVFVPRDVDHYGRVIARVWAGETDVNRELVRRGSAWFYPEYAEDDSLYQEEQRARAAKVGLWAMPGPRLEPWEWRRRERQPTVRDKLQGQRTPGE
jgi:micrococcal nuclease